MSKNCIYMVNIPTDSSKIDVRDYAQYSIATWEHYCSRHDIDLIVNTEPDPRFTYPIWNKELVYIKANGYERIGIVDCDTMIRWDAPNIFDLIYPKKIYGVLDHCDLNWLLGSVNDRKHFFPDVDLDIFKYVNAGVIFMCNDQLHIFEKLLDFYLENKTEIEKIKGGGREQTLLNYFIQKHTEVELLQPSWNLISIHKKNMFGNNWQLKQDAQPYFMRYAWLWHFTGFAIEDRVRIMRETYDYTNKQCYQ